MTEKAEIITLENGLRIVFQRSDDAKTCALGAWVASGSSFETPEKAGVSHFIEHMVFKGTEKRSALDVAVETDEIGGVINAYTAKETTCFYARALSEHMPKALDIICDMITNPRLDGADLEIEKGVIKEEIAMYEDSPEDLCLDAYYENVWKGSALGGNILGCAKTVEALKREDLETHMRKFYVPERTVLSFGGGFDKEAALKICRKYFSGMKNTGFPLTPAPADYNACVVRVKKDFMQNQIILGFPGTSLYDERRNAVSLIACILGASSSSRLFQKIREEKGLAYSVDCVCVSHLAAGLFTVSMSSGARTEKRAITEALKIIEEFPDAVTEKELARAKEQTVLDFVMSLENVSSVASRNGADILFYNRLIPESEIVEKIDRKSVV